MKKKFRNLDKKWKEILYAASGFGPNMLMVLMGAYFTDAINPAALPSGSLQAISDVCLIMPLLFPILWMIAKIFDGLIDIPLAALTDNLKTKWGRRRLPIAICFIPMVVSYALCWIPIGGTNQSINTIWIICMALIFFATYTMNLIAFYGSLSTVCVDEKQRLRVSSFKAFFDTISYCLIYALIPVLLQATGLHIDKFVMLLIPLMVTMTIPLFMIKEGDKFERKAIAEGYEIIPLSEEKKVGIWESIKLTFTNKIFLKWCLVNCCAFFGLQMFLVSMNALILGGMGLSGAQMSLLNTCAFAPVPIMLYLFNKLKAKKGIRFSYQTCLLSFAVCILFFDLGNLYFMGSDNVTLQIVIGCIGGVVGSWAIGSFFMMPYMIPSQISSVEEKLTGKNHSAMFFAAQAVTSSIVGAVASSLVYENIKMLFISKQAKGVVWAENAILAAQEFGNVEVSSVFNLGTLLVPVIVSICCFGGFILAFKMPKNYSPREVAKELNLETEYENNRELFNEEDKAPFEDESIMVDVTLWILSGSLFGLIWRYAIINTINILNEKKIKVYHWIISIFLPPYFAYIAYLIGKKLKDKNEKLGYERKDLSVFYLIFAIFGLNFISYIIMQKQLNKIAKSYNE